MKHSKWVVCMDYNHFYKKLYISKCIPSTNKYGGKYKLIDLESLNLSHQTIQKFYNWLERKTALETKHDKFNFPPIGLDEKEEHIGWDKDFRASNNEWVEIAKNIQDETGYEVYISFGGHIWWDKKLDAVCYG